MCTIAFFLLGIVFFCILGKIIFLFVPFVPGLTIGFRYYQKALEKGFDKPEVWNFNFVTKKLDIKGVNFHRVFDLTKVSSVILYVVTHVRHEEGNLGESSKEVRTYFAKVGLKGLADDYPIFFIGISSSSYENQEHAYNEGVCSASLFCHALGVPLVGKDVDSRECPKMNHAVPVTKRKLSLEEYIDDTAFGMVSGPFSQAVKY